ncbi:MAG TPA: hypothetical protein VGR21_07020 [Cryptosporangiaceae bacterium]|nr:hypothetical protein [Cryptosporangiaceae bacterium]
MTDAGPTAPPPRVVARLERFAVAHGGSAMAVVEHLGRPGARIVLVGADGTWGDQVVESVAEGRAACEAAGVPVADTWERALANGLRTAAGERTAMGRR